MYANSCYLCVARYPVAVAVVNMGIRQIAAVHPTFNKVQNLELRQTQEKWIFG